MVHLPEEALLAGPVNYRSMYPIERYIILIICLCIISPRLLICIVLFYFGRLLGELKKSVRNRAKPKWSTIEAWVQHESLTFCGLYLKDVETAFNRLQRNNDKGMRKEKLSVFAQKRMTLWRSCTRRVVFHKWHGGNALVHTEQLWRDNSILRWAWRDDEVRTSITFVCQETPRIVSTLVSRICKL